MRKIILNLVLITGLFFFFTNSAMAETGITSPQPGEGITKGDVLYLEAEDVDAANGGVSWAVREGTCAMATNTVAGNVDGFSDVYDWAEGHFKAELDTTSWELGEYCFIFNPAAGGRYTQWFYIEAPAAPAVAAKLLHEAGISPRYGSGKTGGNFISDVAHEMDSQAYFQGTPKEEEIRYECKIANFLNNHEWMGEINGKVQNQWLGVLNPGESDAIATNNYNGTITLEIIVKDLCGYGITGLNPLEDFYVRDSVIGGPFYFGTGSIPGSSDWIIGDGTYSVTLERNSFDSRPKGYEDGWFRIWDIYVLEELVEKDLKLETTYYAVGNWKLNLYVGSTLHERFIIIQEQDGDGNITGLSGIGYNTNGAKTGEITGWINGQEIEMLYRRTDITTNYTAKFKGAISSHGNYMSGTWSDYARTDEPWNMIKQ